MVVHGRVYGTPQSVRGLYGDLWIRGDLNGHSRRPIGEPVYRNMYIVDGPLCEFSFVKILVISFLLSLPTWILNAEFKDAARRE